MLDMNSLLQELNQEVDLALHRLDTHPHACRVLDGSVSARGLASYYVSARHTVRLAPHFLRQSYEQLQREGAHPELLALLEHKIEEESGHDAWLTQDLTAIGYAEHDLRPAPAADLYNTFHAAVIPLSGAAFLGTAWILESLAVKRAGIAAARLQSVARISGIRPDSSVGLRFLSSHHAADIEHTEVMAAQLTRWITQPSAQHYMRLCAHFTATVYADFFNPEPALEAWPR